MGLLKFKFESQIFCYRVAGNAAFLLGAILKEVVGRKKTIERILDEKRAEDTSYLLLNLTALVQSPTELEAITNASGTISLLVGILYSINIYFFNDEKSVAK